MPQLGRLEPVDLRTCWVNEATHFTPWLASETNLALLSEAIEMELELAGQEQWVGPFRADILCKNMASEEAGEWVLIENQLERTDHTHLGQLLTYAAGLHACSIIWIASRFTDEHRAALDWLNEHTLQEIKFFGLEIQLWRIGNSDLAPKFNVICRPNNYSRTVTARRDANNQVVSFRYRYWSQFLSRLKESPGSLKIIKPSDQNWINFAMGRTGFSISLVINSRDKWIRVELYLAGSSAKNWFRQLKEKHRKDVEEILGELEWEELSQKRDCRIAIYRRNSDAKSESDWLTQHSWLAENTKKFHEVFTPLAQKLGQGISSAEPSEGFEEEISSSYSTSEILEITDDNA